MTKELINEFYDALISALPQYNIFLNDDGKKMRNPARVEGQEAEITCVEDALSTVGVAIVVCARMTSRVAKSDVVGASLRTLKLPIEIRTQRVGSVEPPPVLDILDDLETAIIGITSRLANVKQWTLEEAGEFENRQGWGFLIVSKVYSVSRK